MNLFNIEPVTTPPPSLTKQIEKIRAGIVQKSMIITAKTSTPDKCRIRMINELLKN